jgi:hypothetical protein
LETSKNQESKQPPEQSDPNGSGYQQQPQLDLPDVFLLIFQVVLEIAFHRLAFEPDE